MSEVRVFFHKDLKERLSDSEQAALKADFKQYKETGIVPYTFGRDAPYNHPNSLPIVKAECLSHIHLGDPDNPWPLHLIQFYRTSDIHLVYCQGHSDEKCYLLMAILSPNAHDLANNRTIMFNLGKMAERFRSQY